MDNSKNRMDNRKMFLLYPGTTMGSYFLEGGLLELHHHLSPPLPLLLLHTHTIH